MLLELGISNFAIIDRLNLHFGPGFNALTGETGAGKSIIIDAMSALLGAKLGAEFVRHGFPTARVEGLFDIARLPAEARAKLNARLAAAGLLDEPADAPSAADGAAADVDNALTLSREIHASGRTVARINGSLVNLATLQDVGQLLIDIHGQTEHQSLLRPGTHIELLDQHAGVGAERAQLADLVIRLRQVRKDLITLQRDERELARRAALLQFQVEEIERAELVPGEDEELAQERSRLLNAERLGTLADSLYALLIAGADESEGYVSRGSARGGRALPGGASAVPGRAVRDALGEATRLLAELVHLDPLLGEQEGALQALLDGAEELGRSVRHYREQVEHDPERLMQVEERLGLLHDLKRKYGATIEEIIEFGRQAAAELDTLTHSEERIADLLAEEADLLDEAGQRAAALSEQRRESGERLARAVEQAMRELHMGSIQFATGLSRSPAADGLPVDGADGQAGTWAFDTRGIDRVEFLISPNPGEPLKALSRIASGGETSRLMLAMKSILSAADQTPTLIFDEIDAGVGGRSGQVVGEKLWSLTDNHQVICITHLPQIAAFADTHFRITKQVKGQRTSTQVDELTGGERAVEIAAMLGGTPVTATSLDAAQEIIRHTAQIKALRDGATASDLLTLGDRASRPPGDAPAAEPLPLWSRAEVGS